MLQLLGNRKYEDRYKRQDKIRTEEVSGDVRMIAVPADKKGGIKERIRKDGWKGTREWGFLVLTASKSHTGFLYQQKGGSRAG
jgi:hypothetical protein